MAIYYEYIITVNGSIATLNKDIYLYKNNKNIDYYFIIKNADFNFLDLDSNKLDNAPYASIKLLNPSGKKILSKKADITNGKVHLRINETLIDEDSEIGTYTFQIDLYDGENGRVSIPPIVNKFHVLDSLFDDDEAILIDEDTTEETTEEVVTI